MQSKHLFSFTKQPSPTILISTTLSHLEHVTGPEESRAWTVRKNTPAPKAASVIHTDFEKNFIRAEAVSCEDFIKYGSAEKCKENGKLRIEGKDYIVKDGDVLHFRVNP